MQAGKLRTPVKLLCRVVESRDAMGEAEPAWCEYASAWVEIVKETGGEAMNDGERKVESLRVREIRMRYDPRLRATDRIRFPDGSEWDVSSAVDVGGRRRELLATACLTT